MDNVSLYSLIALVSAIGFFAGIALLIVSIVMTVKKKKKFGLGIAGGIVLVIAGAVFVVVGVLGAFVTVADGLVSNLPMPTEFTPAEGSRPVSGTLKIDGHEVTMPCTISDIQHMGYTTDYEYFNNTVDMWPSDNKNGKYEPPHFLVFIDNSYGYESHDHVRGDDQVSAVKIQYDNGIGIEFNEVKFGMSREEFIKIYGTPAYEIDNPVQGDFLYYVGDNDTIYRFQFDSRSTLWGIMYGTSDYMQKEMNWLYH